MTVILAIVTGLLLLFVWACIWKIDKLNREIDGLISVQKYKQNIADRYGSPKRYSEGNSYYEMIGRQRAKNDKHKD